MVPTGFTGEATSPSMGTATGDAGTDPGMGTTEAGVDTAATLGTAAGAVATAGGTVTAHATAKQSVIPSKATTDLHLPSTNPTNNTKHP
jgi:hypothetical protein